MTPPTTRTEVAAAAAVPFHARLLDAAGEAIIVTDPHGILTYANAAAERLYGWRREELIGRPVLDFTVSEALAGEASEIMATLASGDSWSGEFLVRDRSGREFAAEVVDTPVFDDAGNLVAVIGISRDISDKKQAQEHLRSREQWFRMLLARSSEIVAVVDDKANLVYANPAAERVLGFRPDDHEGRNMLELVHPDDVAAVADLFFAGVGRPGLNAPSEFRFRTAGDGWRVLRAVSTNCLDDPAIRGIIVNAHDVTEEHEASVSLRRSETMLLEAQRIAHVGHWRFEFSTGRLEWPSDEVYAIHGIGREEWGCTFDAYLELVHPDDRALVVEAVEQASRTGAIVLEHRIVRPDGGVRHLVERGEVAADGGRPGVLIGTCLDITERKSAEIALENANRSLRLITSCNQTVAQASDTTELLHEVCRIAVEDGGFDAVWIGDASGDGRAVCLARDPALTQGLHDDPQVRSAALSAVRSRAPHLVEDDEVRGRPGGDDLLALPLLTDGRCVGAFVVRSAAGFDGSVDLLQELANDIAFAIAVIGTRGALEENEERFRAIVETAGEGICLCDTRGVITYANPRFAEMLERADAALVGTRLSAYLAEDDRDLLRSVLDRTGHEQETFEARLRSLRGDEIDALVAARRTTAADPARGAVLFMVTDISERKRAERELERLSLEDSLTGLPNRALFLDRLGQALARATRQQHRVGVLFIDIDHFKFVNDSLGHGIGDQLLRQVALRLQVALEDGVTTVARLGGDDFAVVHEAMARTEDAVRLAGRVKDALAEPFEVGDRRLHVAVTIGIAVGPPGSADGLLANADAAMYRAKNRGRNRFELFDVEMRTQAMERLVIETSLRDTLRSGRLEVHYQPVMRLGDGELTGFEALARWPHPERGYIAPIDFIPLAEESGLIEPLGLFVLEDACRHLAAWTRRRGPDAPLLSVAVNLSGRQLLDPTFAVHLHDMLERYAVAPSQLVLEITESVLMDDAHTAAQALDHLRSFGISLAVDDFGTGYSSLLYLRRFPVQILKLDRFFVAGVAHNAEDRAIVESIIGLARALGLESVAEGVETAEQVAALRELHCDLAQGWYWSKALLPDEVEAMIVLGGPVREAEPSVETPPAASTVVDAHGLHVVVIDDHAEDRRLFSSIVEATGSFRVVGEAHDAAQGVQVVERLQPDVVLLDLSMPGGDGLAALPDLRAAAPAARVVVLSGFVSPALRRLAMEEGAAECLDKSTDAARLIDVLLEVCGRLAVEGAS